MAQSRPDHRCASEGNQLRIIKMRTWFVGRALGSMLLFSSAAIAEDPKFEFLGFAQLTAEHVESDDGIAFGADRIRLRGVYEIQKFSVGLMLDLNAGDLDARAPGTLPNVIADAFVAYRFDSKHQLKLGQFKTPVGLDFNTSGQSLHITKRGMEAGLVLARDLGLMLSGRKIGAGFGYDVGMFNVAGRSLATEHLQDQVGDANAWAARVLYDTGPWHLQAAYGVSEEAGGTNSENYRVFNVSGSYTNGPWTAVLEWIDGDHVRGEIDRNERVAYAHLGYRVSPSVEFVARHYDGESRVSGLTTDLGNTFLGANVEIFKNENSEGRLQLNYLIIGGNAGAYTGVRAFRSDAVLIQFQWLVRR